MNKKSLEYDEYIKQLTAGAQQLPSILPEIISTLFTKPSNDKTKDDIEKITYDITEMLTKVAPNFSELINIENTKDRSRAILNLAETGLKPYIKNIPPGKNLIDFLIEFLDTQHALPSGSYLLETSYSKYTDTVTELSKDFVINVPIIKRSEFLDSVFSSEKDVLSMGQSVITEYPEMNKQFSVKRKRFTKQQAIKNIKYYETLAGHYEKCISVVSGILKLIIGENVTYEMVRRQRLASNIKTVSNSKYYLLTSGFNKHIRNALAHKQILINTQKRNVTFYDPLSHISMDLTYKEIDIVTKDLCALFISIQRLPMQIWSDTFTKFKESI